MCKILTRLNTAILTTSKLRNSNPRQALYNTYKATFWVQPRVWKYNTSPVGVWDYSLAHLLLARWVHWISVYATILVCEPEYKFADLCRTILGNMVRLVGQFGQCSCTQILRTTYFPWLMSLLRKAYPNLSISGVGGQIRKLKELSTVCCVKHQGDNGDLTQGAILRFSSDRWSEIFANGIGREQFHFNLVGGKRKIQFSPPQFKGVNKRNA